MGTKLRIFGCTLTVGAASIGAIALPNIALRTIYDKDLKELEESHTQVERLLTDIIGNANNPETGLPFLSGTVGASNELKDVEFHPEPENEKLVLSCDYRMRDINNKIFSYANRISVPLEAEDVKKFQAATHIYFSEEERRDWAENDYYRFPIITCTDSNQLAYKSYYDVNESTQIYNLIYELAENCKNLGLLGIDVAVVGTEITNQKESKIETKVMNVSNPVVDNNAVKLGVSVANYDANNPSRDVAVFNITINFNSSFVKNPTLVFEGTAQQAIEVIKDILNNASNIFGFSGSYCDFSNSFSLTIEEPKKIESNKNLVDNLRNIKEEDLSERVNKSMGMSNN